MFSTFQNIIIQLQEHMFLCPGGKDGRNTMSKERLNNDSKEQLISYIKSLSVEQAEEAMITASAWLAERQEA